MGKKKEKERIENEEKLGPREKDAQGRDECRPKGGWPHLHS